MKCLFLAIFCYSLSLHNAPAMLAEIMIWWRLFSKLADKKSFSAVFYEKEDQKAGISEPSDRVLEYIKLIAGGVYGFSSFHIFISLAFHFFFSHGTFRGKGGYVLILGTTVFNTVIKVFYSHVFPSQNSTGALFTFMLIQAHELARNSLNKIFGTLKTERMQKIGRNNQRDNFLSS